MYVDNEKEMLFIVNEDGKFERCEDPYAMLYIRSEEEFEKLKEIVEKSGAKKLIKKDTIVGSYICPTCKAHFVDECGITNYCGNCGQKLDWNGEK